MQNTLSNIERADRALERSLSARLSGLSAQVRSLRGLRLSGAARALVLAASFVLSASTWTALSDLAGYPRHLGVLMAVTVDGYIVTALLTWLYASNPRIADFARKHTYGAASAGVIAQSAYHGMLIWTNTATAWKAGAAVVVGIAPPLFSAFAVHLSATLARDLDAERARAAMSAEMSAHGDETERLRGLLSEHGDDERSWDDMVSAQNTLASAHERTTERVSVTERLTERATIARADALPQLIGRLSAGGALTGSSVADEYGVSEATGRRWLSDARSLAGMSAHERTERSLTLIRGEGERS